MYTELSTLKQRIEYKGDDYYDIHPEEKFDELLTQLEKESRQLINNHKGSAGLSFTFEKETDRTDTIRAPNARTVQLVYPVQNVSKVEIELFDKGYNELDDTSYDSTRHNLILQRSAFPFINDTRQRKRKLDRNITDPTWNDICTKVRVTYTRGYDSIPENVKNVQIQMINKMLRNLRMEQGIQSVEPDNVSQFVDAGTVMSEDIRQSLDDISASKSPVVAV